MTEISYRPYEVYLAYSFVPRPYQTDKDELDCIEDFTKTVSRGKEENKNEPLINDSFL